MTFSAAQLIQKEPREQVVTGKAPICVLVVDDDRTKRLALTAALSPLGVAVVEAESGVAALRCVTARDFAVILLDVRMPMMDGFETAALIRQRERSEMTPIIFITASTSDEMVDKDRYAEGAVDFIFAPVNPSELRAKVSVFANLFLNADTLATQAREAQISADELRLLTDVAPIGIFRTDNENRYVYVNPRWCEITGIPHDDALGLKLGFSLELEQRFDVLARLTESEPRAEFTCRYEIPGPDSSTRIAIVTAVAIPTSQGGTAGWAGTLADITAEAGAEAALSEARDAATAATQLKSDFLANMSHEIRTPMNGVIGMADLLLETALDTHQRDYAQVVRNSAEALLTIINGILDFSKLEAAMLDLEESDFDLRTEVEAVVDLLAGSAQAKGLELMAAVENSVPAVVRGDPGRLRQVLMNLVGNAIKFTQSGEVVIRVSTDDIAEVEMLLHFEISDTGDGIAPDKLGVIFQPFVQADTSTSRRYGGTGLGLSISGQLVTLMGGDYGVTSEPGQGSTFWFTIRVAPDGGRGRDGLPLRVGEQPNFAGRTVLVVDDSPSQRGLLAEQLTAWGMKVTTEDSCSSALLALQESAAHRVPFSVALLDRSMPGMSGLELRDSIIGDPLLAATPLVLMIGLGQERDLGTGETSGFAAFLTKPVHREGLLDCLRVAMGLVDTGMFSAESVIRPQSARRLMGRLLLAEDNLINQKVAVAMLTSAGYQVDSVLDGAAAVQATAIQRYDAILMDCQMPGLNGYEATAAIRAREGSDRHTPIIAMTAGARAQDRERCLSAGMDSYLAKPVSKAALVSLVTSSVENSTPPLQRPSIATRSAGEPALDPLLFDELRALGEPWKGRRGEDLVVSLVDVFIADTDAQLVLLREAVAAADDLAVRHIAGMIKASGGELGARRLARSCDPLEGERAPGLLTHGASDLERVEDEYRTLRQALALQLSSGARRPLRRRHGDVTTAATGPGDTGGAPTAASAPDDPDPAPNDQRSGRILLAEDNPIGWRVATAMFESLGYGVDVTTDADEILQAVLLGPYKAIFIDCTAPILDCERTTGQIRHLQQAGSPRTPIIAVSASPTESDRRRCLASGMDDYLAKPLSVARLEAALTRWSVKGSQHPGPSAHGSVRATDVLPAEVARPVLDAEVLEQLEQLGQTAGEDFVAELAVLFLADADIHVQALRQGFADADIDIVTRSAHALSGASANMGATELARLCATAATERGAKELLGDESLLEAVESELAQVRLAFADRIPVP